MTAKSADRRRFNGRKPGTFSEAEKAKHAANGFARWADPAARARLIDCMRKASETRRAAKAGAT